MPLFEGMCPTHGRFERLMARREPLIACPECGHAGDVLPSAPGLRFVGDGFQTPRAQPPALDTGATLKQNRY